MHYEHRLGEEFSIATGVVGMRETPRIIKCWAHREAMGRNNDDELPCDMHLIGWFSDLSKGDDTHHGEAAAGSFNLALDWQSRRWHCCHNRDIRAPHR